jgi:hypothetical protein
MAVRPVGPVTAALNQPVLPPWQQLRRLVDLARGVASPSPSIPSTPSATSLTSDPRSS